MQYRKVHLPVSRETPSLTPGKTVPKDKVLSTVVCSITQKCTVLYVSSMSCIALHCGSVNCTTFQCDHRWRCWSVSNPRGEAVGTLETILGTRDTVGTGGLLWALWGDWGDCCGDSGKVRTIWITWVGYAEDWRKENIERFLCWRGWGAGSEIKWWDGV